MENVENIKSQLCKHCGISYLPVSLRQLYCSHKCQEAEKNLRRGLRRKGMRITAKSGSCEVCGLSIKEALESHHYTRKDTIILCGSCHNIWHRLSKETHSLRDMVISTVSNHLPNSQNSLTNAPNFYQKSIKELLTTKGA